MESCIKFMALGGSQRVGASCYYLGLGRSNILLDCGKGAGDGLLFYPDTLPLLTEAGLHGIGEIEKIFISHAHGDHIAYLPEIIPSLNRTTVYMTELTAILAEYQMLGRTETRSEAGGSHENYRLAVKSMLDNSVKVNYYKTVDFGEYSVTFYPAGHIPGAMMTLIEYKGKKILYTGDFSKERTPLCSGYMLPEDLKPDIIIMCGLHFRNIYYTQKEKLHKLNEAVKRAMALLKRGKSVYFKTKQLSKGIEFLKVLNVINSKRKNPFKIYIEENIMQLINRLENYSIPLFCNNNYSASTRNKDVPHIVLGTRTKGIPPIYNIINADFSLHDDFSNLAEFIKKFSPKTVAAVHCSNLNAASEEEVIRCLKDNYGISSEIIFPRERKIYNF